jgi:trehalose/maltose hydrolase-like predicted phosphorylase
LWQVAMLGFAGVQPAGETLSLTPRLPPQWTAMTFRTQWHRRELHMRITHDAVIATLERGAAMTLTVNGQAYPLTPETPSRIALSPPGNG